MTGAGCGTSRAVARAQLQVGDRTFGVVSCHLSLVGERRVHEVRRVLDAAEGLQGPVVLAGDLNEDPGVPADLLAAAGDHRPVLAELELR